jgi:arylsulfatase A-like enzyme
MSGTRKGRTRSWCTSLHDSRAGLLPAGRVIETEVEAMDLAPTVLELAGIAVPDRCRDSRSWPPPRRGRALAIGQHDPERNHGARDQVRALPHDSLGRGPHRALRRDRRSARAHRTGRQASHRASPDAQRACPAGRLRERVEEALWGSPASPNEAFYSAN